MRAKIGISLLSISLIASFGLTSNQVFAGPVEPELPHECQDCIVLQNFFEEFCSPDTDEASAQFHGSINNCQELEEVLRTCASTFCPAVGGVFEGVNTTSLLVSGAQMNASWMIPVIVSGIGIAIVIARKF